MDGTVDPASFRVSSMCVDVSRVGYHTRRKQTQADDGAPRSETMWNKRECTWSACLAVQIA